jgi:phosphoribosyl 1,2-cyclic phosphodiesterase
MKVTCFGARGSLPSPSRKGFSTVEYGGNTSCYLVEAGPFRIILDHGSGAQVLGDYLMSNGQIGVKFISLISHYHWDHIQGLPFCTPYYIKSNEFHIHGHEPPGHEGGVRNTVERLLSEQQVSPHFPVAHGSFPSCRRYVSQSRLFSETWYYHANPRGEYSRWAEKSEDSLEDQVIKITTIPLQHPDGCLGYRIEYMGKSVAYCSDYEPMRHTSPMINRLAADVDLLIADGQYSEATLANSTQGYGHGTPRSCVEQAQSCRAKEVWVHHHDPRHDDKVLEMMELDAKSYAVTVGYTGTVNFAREGEHKEL